MRNFHRREGRPARSHRILNTALVSALFAALVAATGLALLMPTPVAAARDRAATAAQSVPSPPDLLWMNGAHAGGSGRAALSPDGQTLATLDYAEVYLWRYSDGQLQRTIGAPWIDSLKCVRFTPDGQFVVAGGTWIPGSPNASTMRMWRVSDGSLVREFAVTADVHSLALSADGTQMAAAIGGGNPNVALFDVATGNSLRTFGSFAANAVAFSRDGFVAATGADQFGDPPTVDVWRASDGLQVAKLAGLSFISNVVAFSPDGRYLAAGDWGGNNTTPKVLVWLAPTFTPVQSLSPYASSDGTIAFSPDSQSIAIVNSSGGGVTVYHLPDGLPLSVVPVSTGSSTWNLIFSDSNTLFGSGAQGLAGVWRVLDGALLRTIGDERYFPSNSIAFSPDSAHLAVSNHATTGFSRVWQVEVLRASDGASERLLASHEDIINSVAYSPDGTLVASGSGSPPPDTQDTRIFISPVAGGAPLILPGHSGGTTSVAFSPDGTLLASGGRDNVVRFWRVADGSVVRSMSGHANWVNTVAFSPDGQTLASASGDSTVKLWRVADGTLLRTIPGNGFPVGSAAFSPDGQTIALAANTSVQLWRVADGTLLRTMNVEAGVNNLNHVVFSVDGSMVSVADGSYPPSIWLWRASDGATLKTYNGETGWVQPPALAFSPDGAMLAVGRYDGHVEAARTPFTAAEVAAYTPAYEGADETTDCNQITGWAWDSKQPNGTVDLDVYDGATLLATVPANHYRSDLADKGNGYHGFTYTIPSSLKHGTPHTLAVKFSGTNTDLTGSPRSITCGTVPLPGTWAAAAPMPTARRALAAGVIDGRIYAAGGDSNAPGTGGGGSNALAAFEVYDPATDTWATLPPMPTGRFGLGAGVINGKLYTAGGWYNGATTASFKALLEVYDPATNGWASLAPMPTARYNVGAGAIGGKLYVVGGWDSVAGTPSNKLEAYDPATDSWAPLTPMPTARYNVAVTVLDGKLYAAGGTCNVGCSGTSFEVYDPAADSWTSLAPMPVVHAGGAAAAVGGKIYVIGGNASTSVGEVDVYDPATDFWTQTTPMQTPRNFLAGVAVGTSIYTLGGVDTAKAVRNTVEVYTPGSAPAPTPTPTPTSTPNPTPTSTPTPTPAATPTPTPVATPTPTPIPTPSPEPVPTPTPSPTPSPSPTPAPTPAPTATPTPTPTPTPEPSPTPTPTPVSTPTPTPSPTPSGTSSGPPLVSFASDIPPISEATPVANVAVRRTGDLSQTSSVDYATADGTAREGYDYMMACGTLVFAPGESEKQVAVHLINDSYPELDETFTLTLSNPSGAVLGDFRVATITIRDDDTQAAPANPVDDTQFFVRQHYLDFLSREPDSSGARFWANNVESCGADARCREVMRINTSAAFFLSIEFQGTGDLVYKMYKASFGNLAGKPVAVERMNFLADTQTIQGTPAQVIVGQGNWQVQLEANKTAFAQSFVQRPAFQAAHGGQSASAFVDSLFANAGVTPTTDERNAAIDAFDSGGVAGQAAALRSVAESNSVSNATFNESFVLMQYFGYLQRDPDAAPDGNFSGYNFWLSKLNQFGGNFVQAEMVKAFITSTEYRQRFGQP